MCLIDAALTHNAFFISRRHATRQLGLPQAFWLARIRFAGLLKGYTLPGRPNAAHTHTPYRHTTEDTPQRTQHTPFTMLHTPSTSHHTCRQITNIDLSHCMPSREGRVTAGRFKSAIPHSWCHRVVCSGRHWLGKAPGPTGGGLTGGNALA